MPYKYLDTAPLTTKPLNRHLPENEPPEVPRTEAEYAKAMMASAQETQKRLTAENRIEPQASFITTKGVRIGATNADVMALIKKRPGITTEEIADHFGHLKNTMSSRLSRMAKNKDVLVRKVTLDGSSVREFYPVGYIMTKVKRPAPLADRLRDYIAANPGCTTNEMADHFGVTRQKMAAKISGTRDQAGIVSKRNGGNNPSRHWLVEDVE